MSGHDRATPAPASCPPMTSMPPTARETQRPVTAPETVPGQAAYGPPAVYVTYDGETLWLECDHGDGNGTVITPIGPGDKWDDKAAEIARHQAEHGCAAQEPKPAPELRAAMAESRQLREQLRELLDMFHGTGSGYSLRLSGVHLTRWYTSAGIPVPDRLRKLEGQ